MKKYLYFLILFAISCAKDSAIPAETIVDFEFTPQNPKINETIVFNNLSKFANGFIWDYGDGSKKDTTVHGQHKYIQNGNYTVILTAFTDAGIKTLPKIINVQGLSLPIANFDIDLKKPFVGAALANFINKSQNATSYRWQFGIREFSTLKNPSRTYSSSGTFDVVLTAYNSNGDSSVKTKQITIKQRADSLLITQITIVNAPTTFGMGYDFDVDSDPDYLVAIGNWIDTSKKRTSTKWDNKNFPITYNLSANPIYLPVEIGAAVPLNNKIYIYDNDVTFEHYVDELDFIIANYIQFPDGYQDEITLTNGTSTIKLQVIWK